MILFSLAAKPCGKFGRPLVAVNFKVYWGLVFV